jgi:spore germination protein YaaH
MAVLMTYDDHWSGGPAGAIAPLDWVGDVVNYATKYIPANKLLLGLEFYGYDWNISDGGSAAAIGYDDIVSTILDTGGKPYMDPQSHTPVYTYQGWDGTHQIWFENSTSLGYKLNLIENKGLAGWGGWRVGLEDENFWSLNLTGQQA